jgi:protein-S-isoprenylcysteine O-methyltransferase Ste14
MSNREKLSFMGSGPIIGAVAIPWLAVSLFISFYYPAYFMINFLPKWLLTGLGIFLFVVGFAFYLATVRTLIQGLRTNKLITTGPYQLCQNPLYAAFILFIVPGICFLAGSWLSLTTSLIAWLIFKLTIGKEYKQLERIFGDDYLEYKNNTNELIPWKL